MKEEKDKKAEYLKREGIRTMQKDIARLREIETQKKGERVAVLKPEEKVEKKPLIKEVVPPPPPAEKISIEEKKIAWEVVEGKPPFPPFAVAREVAEARPHLPPSKAREIKEEERIAEEKEEEKRIAEEIERRVEEAKRKKEEEEKERIARLKENEEILSEKRFQLQKELSLIPEKRKPIEEEKSRLLVEIEKIKRERLTPILTKEKEIEKEKQLIEEEERKAPFQKKKEIEEKRWQIEEKREEIENEKWVVEEEIIKIQEKIKEVDLRIEELDKKAEKLKEECENIINEEEAINLLKKKVNLEKEFKLVEDQRLTFEIRAETLIKKKNETERVLTEILESEKALEEEIEILEKKEEVTTDLTERREIEKRRREIEQERKETEKEKWQIVQRQEKESQEVKKIQFEVEKFKKMEQELEKKLEEIDISLKKIKERGVKIEDLLSPIEVPQPEKKRVFNEIERKKKMSPTPKPTPPSPPPSPPPPLTPPISEKIPETEKPVKIEMEERTEVAEDSTFISRPRPAQAIEEEMEKELKPSFPSPPEGPPEILIPKPPPEKPKPSLKILIRGIIITFFLLFLSSLLYWFFWIRKPQIEEPFILPSEEEIIQPTEEVEEVIEEPKVVIPPTLISVEATETLEISALEEIPQALSSLLKKEFPENQFTRIVIKNIEENKVVPLKEIFNAFQIKTPDGFFDKLENDFTLLIYSQKNGNRLALVAKIQKEEELKDLLKSWEKTMEKDFENLFVLMNKKGPALVPYFKDGKSKGTAFRFQTFSRADLGIVYSITKDYFIFTSSWESLVKIFEKLSS